MPSKSLSRSSLLSFQKYSSLLAGNDPYIPFISDYYLLETEVLSGNQAAVEFTNLVSKYSADFQHLELRFSVRSSVSAVVDDLWIFLNNDTGNNYTMHRMRADASSTAANYNNSYGKFYDGGYSNTGNTAPTGSYGGGIVSLLDPFNTNKFTTIRWSGAGMYQSNSGYLSFIGGTWMSFNAVDSVKFDLGTGSYIAGSSFQIFGIKAGV